MNKCYTMCRAECYVRQSVAMSRQMNVERTEMKFEFLYIPF